MLTLVKISLVTCLVAVGVCGFGAVALAGYLYSGGVASVQIDTPDVDLNIPVPMRLFDLGLGAAALAVPNEEFADVREDLGEWRPLLYDLANEVHELPEGEIVRVENGDDLVLITHQDGRLSVEVKTDDTHVKVSAPRRAIGRLLNSVLRLAT